MMKKGLKGKGRAVALLLLLFLVTVVCSFCGYVQGSQAQGSAIGHDIRQRPVDEATCAGPYEVVDWCTQCEYISESYTVGALFHDWKETIINQGNCVDQQIVTHICDKCGAAQPDTMAPGNPEDHDYQSYDGAEEENHVNYFYHCERCTRCGKKINIVWVGSAPVVPEEL